MDVALTPREAVRWQDRVCVVIDELRASYAIVTLLDQGAVSVIPVAGLADGRQCARGHGYLLAGSRGGLRPADYDYSGSPVELSKAQVRGRTVVLRTRNGTRVIRGLASAPSLLIGCLPNLTACARQALSRARNGRIPIGIVCSGASRSFALDDALAAGALTDRLCRLDRHGIRLTDAGMAARRLWTGTRDPLGALRESASGRLLARLGLDEDVGACAEVDTSDTVPVLVPGEPPRLVHAISGVMTTS